MYIKLNCHQKNCLAHKSSDKQCRHTIMMNYFLKLSLSGLWLINYFSSLLLKLLWLIILNRQQYISFFPTAFCLYYLTIYSHSLLDSRSCNQPKTYTPVLNNSSSQDRSFYLLCSLRIKIHICCNVLNYRLFYLSYWKVFAYFSILKVFTIFLSLAI